MHEQRLCKVSASKKGVGEMSAGAKYLPSWSGKRQHRENAVTELKIRACYLAYFVIKDVKIEGRLGLINNKPYDPMSGTQRLVDITHV